jgi:hypothetical protein
VEIYYHHAPAFRRVSLRLFGIGISLVYCLIHLHTTGSECDLCSHNKHPPRQMQGGCSPARQEMRSGRNLTEATRTKAHVTRHPKVVTRNITTKNKNDGGLQGMMAGHT